MRPDEIEELTEQFLKENCSLYSKKNRKVLMSHPYLSQDQMTNRSYREIPLSNLSKGQKQTCYRFGDALDYEES